MANMSDKLIVALDVNSIAAARELTAKLRGVVSTFKVGSQLFTAAGPDFVREIINSGARVFLDLKFHDIPNTVASAAVEATRLGVSIFNVHAVGGSEMMRRTAEAVTTTAQAEGITRPNVIAVTVLTSVDDSSLVELGSSLKPGEMVQRLAVMSEANGMDGVVASPREIGIIRQAVRKPGFLVVTPGVRPSGAAIHDQARIATPREAILAGADYVVVGRTIVAALDPLKAAQEIIKQMAEGAPSDADWQELDARKSV